MKFKEIIRTCLGIIVLPSKYLESASKSIQTPTSICLWTLIAISTMLPYALIKSQSNPLAELYWVIWLFASILAYYPAVYFYGYILWKLGKGFGGQSSYAEMRNTVLFSFLPLIVNLPFTIIYTWMAVSRNDLSLASHQIIIVDWIIWLVGFRILATGIARFNRFSKTQTLLVWFLAALLLVAIKGLVYLIRH